MVDADDNVYLDVFQQIGSLALGNKMSSNDVINDVKGYNNPDVLKAISTNNNLSLLASRPALGYAPSTDYLEQLQSSLLSVSFNYVLLILTVSVR